MTPKLITTLLCTLIVAGAYAWVNRYDMQTVSNMPGYFILDRWTGEGCFVGFGSTTVYRCPDRSRRQPEPISN
jgi:hypothetical protein